jgi:hypothetical protein
MDQALMVRIRERAYHIWAANGGDVEQNWLRAEAEILNNSRSNAQAQLHKRLSARNAKKRASVG